jgi:hypothetical protein
MNKITCAEVGKSISVVMKVERKNAKEMKG